MNTLRDWAEFYRQKRLWIYPYNLDEKEWVYWKNIKSDTDYNQASAEYDWNKAQGIKLVVGKKGVRIVEVSNKRMLKKALHLLSLPEDYPWIIYSTSSYGIIVDTPSVSIRTNGMKNKSYKGLLVLWEGYYVLPTTGISKYFYNNRIPQGHPVQVEDNVFLDCIDALERFL